MGATEAGSKDVEALTALAPDQGDDVSWWVQKAQIQRETNWECERNCETKKEEADAPPNAWGTDGVSAAYVGIYCNDTASSWENKSLRHIKTKDAEDADAKIVLKVSSFHFVSKSTR